MSIVTRTKPNDKYTREAIETDERDFGTGEKRTA